MYYFEILDIIKESDRPLTTQEIFLILNIKKPVPLNTVRSVLQKMYLKCDNITRINQVTNEKARSHHFIYFYIRR